MRLCRSILLVVQLALLVKGRRYASDGLVPVDSALGRHPRPELTLAFDGTWIGFGMGHVEVLERPETYAVLRRWLSP